MSDLKYNAFVSYSHDSDARLASSLQSSLSRFAKPWYRLRTMRIMECQSTFPGQVWLVTCIEISEDFDCL